MTDFRIEEDSLGKVKVPKDAYFGAFTTRAEENFQISGMIAPEEFRIALGYIKLAAARANKSIGDLKPKLANAIEKAAKEFIKGDFDDEFILDVFQAGAGTSYNMNANEIIANRANVLLGGKKGEYEFVHPNNHVNMAQSSNDVVPTATRITLLLMSKFFIQELKSLIKSFEKKSKEFSKIKKVGRTHLQDAVPITLGQEFGGYADCLQDCLHECKQSFEELKKLGIGGTAIGTGVNVHPHFKGKIVAELSTLTEIKLHRAQNSVITNNSMHVFTRFSTAIRNLAIELHRIMNDLRKMNSGPRAGLNEITLPPVQPGSSIMPGKVNPSIAECMSMICGQVIGVDRTVAFAAQEGEFELNWYAPLIMFNTTSATRILMNGFKMLREKCIDGIIANESHIKEVYESSLAEATLLVPELGYPEVARRVKEAVETGKKFKDLL